MLALRLLLPAGTHRIRILFSLCCWLSFSFLSCPSHQLSFSSISQCILFPFSVVLTAPICCHCSCLLFNLIKINQLFQGRCYQTETFNILETQSLSIYSRSTRTHFFMRLCTCLCTYWLAPGKLHRVGGSPRISGEFKGLTCNVSAFAWTKDWVRTPWAEPDPSLGDSESLYALQRSNLSQAPISVLTVYLLKWYFWTLI